MKLDKQECYNSLKFRFPGTSILYWEIRWFQLTQYILKLSYLETPQKCLTFTETLERITQFPKLKYFPVGHLFEIVWPLEFTKIYKQNNIRQHKTTLWKIKNGNDREIVTKNNILTRNSFWHFSLSFPCFVIII